MSSDGEDASAAIAAAIGSLEDGAVVNDVTAALAAGALGDAEAVGNSSENVTFALDAEGVRNASKEVTASVPDPAEVRQSQLEEARARIAAPALSVRAEAEAKPEASAADETPEAFFGRFSESPVHHAKVKKITQYQTQDGLTDGSSAEDATGNDDHPAMNMKLSATQRGQDVGAED